MNRVSIAILALLLPATAFPCSCGPWTITNALTAYDTIFQGTVLHREAPPMRDGRSTSMDMVRYVVAVERAWRGSPPDTVEVFSAIGGASCGVTFRVGAAYLFYCDSYDGPLQPSQRPDIAWAGDPVFPVLHTGLCSGNKDPENAAFDLEVLEHDEAGPAVVSDRHVEGRVQGAGFETPLGDPDASSPLAAALELLEEDPEDDHLSISVLLDYPAGASRALVDVTRSPEEPTSVTAIRNRLEFRRFDDRCWHLLAWRRAIVWDTGLQDTTD